MNRDELIELIKRFEELPIEGNKPLAIQRNNGFRIMIKDAREGYIVGEINYVKRSRNFYYSKLDDGEKVKLLYSNLEKIFINNKKA